MPRQTSARRELKSERIELRVQASVKEVIRRAMSVSGRSAGDLAYEGALRVLEAHERTVVDADKRERFFAALLDPPAPNEKLKAAYKRYKERTL
jgi:uncharacterized protein (DUF1778 family)